MENKLTPELLEKAKQVETPEELAALAKENGIELTPESAKAYFDSLNKAGEISDDELDSVAGGKKCGTCYSNDGRPIVTAFNSCEYYTDEDTGEIRPDDGYCMNCRHSSYTNGYLFCYCGARRWN